MNVEKMPSNRRSPSYRDQRPSSRRASQVLAATSSERTKPELLLARSLWARGLRYRKNMRAMPGRPDLVFCRARVVVFVDGDFWHGRDWLARRSRLERGANAAYWVSKIDYNRQRDDAVTKQLRAAGWQVLRVWESDVKGSLSGVCDRIQQALSFGTDVEGGRRT